MKYVAIVLLVVAGLQLASAKIFERCELAEELLRQGFLRGSLPNWVCLIEAHSKRDTTKVMKLDDGTTQWGLYQINDNFWCDNGETHITRGNLCHIPCQSMLTDNITDASICAQMVYADNGFESWQGWRQFCKPQSAVIPDLRECDL